MMPQKENNTSKNTQPIVMVVEDSADQAAYLFHILSLYEYRVVQVRDGMKALQMMKGGLIPDAILTDIKMPMLNGFELMEKMQRLEIDVPTIIISGMHNDADFEKAFVLGAEDYFVKPFSPLNLLSRLQTVLKSKLIC